MASITKNLIEQIKLNTETDAANIASTAYGVCSNAADVVNKTVEMDGFKLIPGVTIHIKFVNTNSATDPTLNVNNTGAHKIVHYGTTPVGTTAETTGWQAGAIISLTYDNTGDGYWVRDQGYNTNTNKSHTHGNIQNNGTLQANDVAIASGDKLVITDSSNSNRIARSSLSFGAAISTQSQSSKFLREDGTWAAPSYTEYSVFVKSGSNHASGLVPDPGATEGNSKFLCENATWRTLATDDIPSLSPSISITDGTGSAAPKVNVTVNGESGTAQSLTTASTSIYGVTKLSAAADDDSVAATAKSVYDLTQTMNGLVASADALVFIDVISGGTQSTAYTPAANRGHVYKVDSDGLINNEQVEVGDLLICTADNTAKANSSNVNTIKQKWAIIQNNIDGAVFKGRNSFVSDHIIIADGTEGKVKDSGLSVSTDSNGFTINGGTGKEVTVESSYTLGPACEKDFIDSTGAQAITNTAADNELVTARAVYYGLPKINDLHDYTSSDSFYAPETAGSQYQLLVSGTRTVSGNNIYDPQWTPAATLQSITSKTKNESPRAYTTLTLGNAGKRSTTTEHSEGQIEIYSEGSGAHTLNGTNTNTDYSHTFPNYTGYVVQAASTSAVGGTTQPIYIAANGVATALTFTQHRLYYGASNSSLEAATGLYSENGNQLGINISSWPTLNNNPITDILYVNGDTTMTGVLSVGGAMSLLSTLSVSDAVTLNSTLSVASTSTLTGRVGIGTTPDTATTGDQHILVVNGAILITGENNSVAHLDITTSNSIDSLSFIPDVSGDGMIGTSSNLWKQAYFSDSVNLVATNSSAVIDSDGTLVLTAAAPSIKLDTTASGKKDWTLANSNTGAFTLSNGTHTLTGTDYGFKVASYLYINQNVPSSNRYNLYVKGTTYHTGNITIAAASTAGSSSPKLSWLDGSNNEWAIYQQLPSSGTGYLVVQTAKLGFNDGTNTTVYLNSDSSNNNANISFYPNTTNTGSLGLSTNRWKTLYIGNADTYGDEYTPIYWNNGIPTQVAIVNKYTFSFASGATSITPITQSHTNKEKTVVTAIVVDSGISYLNAPIVWEINSSGNIALTTSAATSGIVSGYILTSTGV